MHATISTIDLIYGETIHLFSLAACVRACVVVGVTLYSSLSIEDPLYKFKFVVIIIY